MDSALREGRLGVAPDALHHGHQAIGALWGEMLLEMQQLERVRRVDADDVLGRLARIERKQNRDQADCPNDRHESETILRSSGRWRAF